MPGQVLNVYCIVLEYVQREKVLSLTSGASSLLRWIVPSPFKCAMNLTGKLAENCIWWHSSSHELCLWPSVMTVPLEFCFFVPEKPDKFAGRAKCHSEDRTCSVDCDFLWKLISSRVGTMRKPSCLLLGRGWTWVSGAPGPESKLHFLAVGPPSFLLFFFCGAWWLIFALLLYGPTVV